MDVSCYSLIPYGLLFNVQSDYCIKTELVTLGESDEDGSDANPPVAPFIGAVTVPALPAWHSSACRISLLGNSCRDSVSICVQNDDTSEMTSDGETMMCENY